MGWACRKNGIEEKCVQNINRKSEGKRPLMRPRRKREGNIKTDLRETSWGGVDWIQLAQDRDQWQALVNTVMKLRAPEKVKNFLTI
jgi:hypothetical protein